MENKFDYSKYECPYAHLEKECGHELKGPEGYSDTYGVWCACGFRGPVFYLDPEELNLPKKTKNEHDLNAIMINDMNDLFKLLDTTNEPT